MKLEEFKINETASIKEAINKIEKNQKGFILIENNQKQIKGVLTDGDILRNLSGNIKMGTQVKLCANSKFIKGYLDTPRELLLKKLTDYIKFIPILDKNDKLLIQ